MSKLGAEKRNSSGPSGTSATGSSTSRRQEFDFPKLQSILGNLFPPTPPEVANAAALPSVADNKELFPTVVIYHAACHDGFLAAYTFWRDNRDRDDVEYHAISESENEEKVIPPDVKGKIVYLLDFCYPKDVLMTIFKDARYLYVVDHHEDAASKILEIPEENKLFDETECAATLAWSYFNSGEPLPLLYKYVRAKDLLSDELPNVDEFHIAFDMAIRDDDCNFAFEQVDQFLDDDTVSGLLKIGTLVKAYQKNLISALLRHICFFPVRSGNNMIIIAYLNINIDTEGLDGGVCSECFQAFPFIDLFASFSIDPLQMQTKFYLKSADSENLLANKIATQHGGSRNRNPNGSGASCTLDEITCKLKLEHLDPTPFICMFREQALNLKEDTYNTLTPEYRELLKTKFPDRTLKINLTL